MVSAAKLKESIQEREELAPLFVRIARKHTRVDSQAGPCVLSRLLAAILAKRTQYREGILDTPRMHLSSPMTSDFNRKVTAACRLTLELEQVLRVDRCPHLLLAPPTWLRSRLLPSPQWLRNKNGHRHPVPGLASQLDSA